MTLSISLLDVKFGYKLPSHLSLKTDPKLVSGMSNTKILIFSTPNKINYFPNVWNNNKFGKLLKYSKNHFYEMWQMSNKFSICCNVK